MLRGACAALVLAATSLGAQPTPFHVFDYDIALTLPSNGKRIQGKARLAVRRMQPGDTLLLDLVDMRAERVRIGDAAASFIQDETHLRIDVAGRPDSLLVEVSYSGVPTDGFIIGTDSAGRWTGFGDNWPNRARHWIPSIDSPSDKSTVTWSVNAPSDRRIVANGVLLEETKLLAGESERDVPRTETRWREARPIPVYLMTVAAAPLKRFDLDPAGCDTASTHSCVPQQVYAAPEQFSALPGEFARAGDMVRFYEQLVAPFPYEKLAHVQSSTRYGGMENASAIFYADRLFRTGGAGSSVIAHETAHQWFGDAVTERAWGHVWLSEGFATYFAALWARHAFGDSTFRAEMARTRQVVLRDEAVATRPVIDTLQADLMKLLNRNSYEKGGWTLHMLRALVGDSAFFRGVRDYWTAHEHGTAFSDDLMAAVEYRSQMNLGWFFDQWLRRPGFASLTTRWRYDAASHRVTLDVTQGGRFRPYRLPLAIDVTDAGGRSHRVRVDIPAASRTRIQLPLTLAAAPRRLVFDPDTELLAEIRSR